MEGKEEKGESAEKRLASRVPTSVRGASTRGEPVEAVFVQGCAIGVRDRGLVGVQGQAGGLRRLSALHSSLPPPPRREEGVEGSSAGGWRKAESLIGR